VSFQAVHVVSREIHVSKGSVDSGEIEKGIQGFFSQTVAWKDESWNATVDGKVKQIIQLWIYYICTHQFDNF
jgi:hypothetical protein